MIKAPNQIKPLILLPKVPYQWASNAHINRDFVEVLRHVPSSVLEVSVYRAPDLAEMRQLNAASHWILPCGSAGQGALKFLGLLGDRPRPPVILVTNGEGAKGALHVVGFHSVF